MAEYPRLEKEEKIRKGYKYSYRCYLITRPQVTMEDFESGVNWMIKEMKSRFPLKQFAIAYTEVGVVPSLIDFVFVFEKDPNLTHREFFEQIKSVASELYWCWDLGLKEIILLEKPFPWIWVGLLLLLGFLGLGEKKG